MYCRRPYARTIVNVRPPPDEKTLRDALLRTLRQRGLEPKDGWISVRLAHGTSPQKRTYMVIIGYEPARGLLTQILRRATGSSERSPTGVWVLDESEARELCR